MTYKTTSELRAMFVIVKGIAGILLFLWLIQQFIWFLAVGF